MSTLNTVATFNTISDVTLKTRLLKAGIKRSVTPTYGYTNNFTQLAQTLPCEPNKYVETPFEVLYPY